MRYSAAVKLGATRASPLGSPGKKIPGNPSGLALVAPNSIAAEYPISGATVSATFAPDGQALLVAKPAGLVEGSCNSMDHIRNYPPP